MKYGPEENTGSPYGGGSWINPYLKEGEVIKRYPQPTKRARLATCMRVLGHPLSVMMKWPEVVNRSEVASPKAARAAPVGTEPTPRKAMGMAEQKALASLLAGIDRTVVRLSEKRDGLRAALAVVESELQVFLLMLQAAGGEAVAAPSKKRRAPKDKKGPKRGVKVPGRKSKKGRAVVDRSTEGPGAVALALAAAGKIGRAHV